VRRSRAPASDTLTQGFFMLKKAAVCGIINLSINYLLLWQISIEASRTLT